MEKIILALLLSGSCLTLVASDEAKAEETKAQDAALSSAADSGICADIEKDDDLGASVIAENPGHVDADKTDTAATAALSTLSLADKKGDATAAVDATTAEKELAKADKKEAGKEEADL